MAVAQHMQTGAVGFRAAIVAGDGARAGRLLAESPHAVDEAEASFAAPTPLLLALRAGGGTRDSIALALLAAGASANLADAVGRPPLLVAAANSAPVAVLSALIANGACVGAADLDGATALHHLAAADAPDHVALLTRAGAPLESEAVRKGTAVAVAASMRASRALAALLAAGADASRSYGVSRLTPLHLVESMCPNEHAAAADCIRLLLAAGAGPNQRDTVAGMTALHRACVHQNVRAVAALLEAGGDLRIKDYEGRTPLALADLRIAAAPATRVWSVGALVVRNPAIGLTPSQADAGSGLMSRGELRRAVADAAGDAAWRRRSPLLVLWRVRHGVDP
jgi:hypothetical protein